MVSIVFFFFQKENDSVIDFGLLVSIFRGIEGVKIQKRYYFFIFVNRNKNILILENESKRVLQEIIYCVYYFLKV